MGHPGNNIVGIYLKWFFILEQEFVGSISLFVDMIQEKGQKPWRLAVMFIHINNRKRTKMKFLLWIQKQRWSAHIGTLSYPWCTLENFCCIFLLIWNIFLRDCIDKSHKLQFMIGLVYLFSITKMESSMPNCV